MGIKRGGVQRKAQLQMHRAVELGTGHAAFSQGFAGYDLGFHPPHGPPIGGICLQVRNAGGGVVGQLHLAVRVGFRVDPVSVEQLCHKVDSGAFSGVIGAGCGVPPVTFGHGFGRHLRSACAAETAIATRRAPPTGGAFGIKHCDLHAGLGQMQCRGKPGVTRTNYRDVGGQVAVNLRPVMVGQVPETIGPGLLPISIGS